MRDGIYPNKVMLINISHLHWFSCVRFSEGKSICACFLRIEFNRDAFFNNALIDMDAKCGWLDYACKVFDKTSVESYLLDMHDS